MTAWVLETYALPYAIGTADAANVAPQRVLERCEYTLMDERELLVHLTGERQPFRHYRHTVGPSVRPR